LKRALCLAIVGLALSVPASAPVDGPLSGNWKIAILNSNGTGEVVNWVIKLETEDGKTTAKLVASNPDYKKAQLVRFAVEGNNVNGSFKFAGRKGATLEYVLDAKLVGKDGKKIVGTFGPAAKPEAVVLTPTDLKELESKDLTHSYGLAALEQANKIGGGTEAAKLYRQVLSEKPGTFSAGRAALFLLQSQAEGTPTEVQNWAETAAKSAEEFGPLYQLGVAKQIAMALVERKHGGLAVKYAHAAEKLLDAKSHVDMQLGVLRALKQALTLAARQDDMIAVSERLTKLEDSLDAEYLAKTPAFKVQPFAGRTAKSDRVVVFELFTGAQCPPCVASDIAFDALQKCYKTTDLVLLQYHLHIPGPDPMTNKDTEARWAQYRQAHGAKSIGGVPTAIMNGKTFKVGGGGEAAAQKVFNGYCSTIDPMLDTEAACKIKASAQRFGSKVQIKAEVADLDKAGPNMKLRLVLAEETIRFVGGNKIRYHHQVVRAMAGGTAGMVLMDKNTKTDAVVDVQALRLNQVAYLDNYEATVQLFPVQSRPLDFRNLRLIAFVQDDTTQEILQAVQVEVTE